MKPQKAYIIRISDPLSIQYSEDAAASCEKIGLPYEFVNGVENKTAYAAWSQCGLSVKTMGIYKSHKIDKAACASVSHALVWNMIVERKETAIILEHDSIMLHPIDADIPDDMIIALGYKLPDPNKYDHVKAGKPTSLVRLRGHEGAHAYALTWGTAAKLLRELRDVGVSLPIDNTFFLEMRKTAVPLYIADPTPAIGWIRESTIWRESSTVNYPFIKSFSENLK